VRHTAHDSLTQPLLESAAAWHDRLQRAKAADETRREFEGWLAASTLHRDAYEAVVRTWGAVKERAEAPSILALRHETALRLTRRTLGRFSIGPLRALAATFVLVVFAVGGLAWLGPEALPRTVTAWVRDLLPGNTSYATATGERLTATLRDGSQVTLDTDSELEVGFTNAQRLVRLKHGQAFFEVAKNESRPFVVQVNDRRLVAVGTAFDVRVDDRQLRVTMVEGTVRVEHANAGSETTVAPTHLGQSKVVGVHVSGPSPTASGGITAASHTAALDNVEVLSAGEQLWVDEERRDHVGTADPERATSWRRGQLVFDAVRLGDAVSEINRYSQIKIRLADPALADVRISGSFATGRTQGFVEAVTSYFPIEVAESSDRAVVLEARR
jgi:transmembrane sensor